MNTPIVDNGGAEWKPMRHKSTPSRLPRPIVGSAGASGSKGVAKRVTGGGINEDDVVRWIRENCNEKRDAELKKALARVDALSKEVQRLKRENEDLVVENDGLRASEQHFQRVCAAFQIREAEFKKNLNEAASAQSDLKDIIQCVNEKVSRLTNTSDTMCIACHTEVGEAAINGTKIGVYYCKDKQCTNTICDVCVRSKNMFLGKCYICKTGSINPGVAIPPPPAQEAADVSVDLSIGDSDAEISSSESDVEDPSYAPNNAE